MKDSYRNPFSGVNAVQLEIDSILEYWCSPFAYELFSEIKEEDIYAEEMNIVFMGGRSTGKSMFLRYWSYPVQFRKAEIEKKKLAQIIQENKGVGFYFRIDGPKLRTFQGNNLSKEQWASIFTHYFELIVGRQYLEVIRSLFDEGSIDQIIIEEFIPKLCELLDFTNVSNLEDVINKFDKRIKHIDKFRGDVSLYDKPFDPDGRIYASEAICFELAELIKKYIPIFKDLNIVILLDEYENFLEYQQIIINTLLRFTKPKIKFRIGMRLEGFRTFLMIAEEDFIKEGREYRKVVFEEVLLKQSGYHEFLIEIARKRLESVDLLREKGFTNIKEILSSSEDLESEAADLVKNKPNLIYETFLKTYKIPKESLDLVRNKNNPLLELMNFIWLLKGVSPQKTLQSMNDYQNGAKSDDAKKYSRDYVDKYKLTLMFLLCAIYRRNKKYYSFNTFAFLSSGIVGHFIELCRRSFAIAGWGENDKLLNEGKIDKDIQATAATDFSIAEKRQISRIEEYGGRISRFVDNLGIIFKDYHRDIRMRYPETNQFGINIDAIENEDTKKALRTAIKWSVIQRKPRMQRSSPSENLENLYTLNRIFSPTFQISYRTRGGTSVLFVEMDISNLMSQERIDITPYVPKKSSNSKKKTEDQLLFPEFYE